MLHSQLGVWRYIFIYFVHEWLDCLNFLAMGFEYFVSWRYFQLNSKELAIFVIQSRDDLFDLVMWFRLVEEVSVVDYEDKGEEAEYDLHVGIAADHKNKIDQLDYSHHWDLPKPNHEGKNRSFELPRVVKGEFHVFEALLDLRLNVDVEYQTTSESCKNDRNTDWLHLEVKQFIHEDACWEKLSCHEKDQ